MISDRDIADLCASLYRAPGAVDVTWDYESRDVANWYAFKRIGDVVASINRGSSNGYDWIGDAEALADPFVHAGLGPVHPFFNAGTDEQIARLLSTAANLAIICGGHSLGAGRASVVTGKAVLAGKAPVARVVFGEPYSTFDQGAAIVARAPGRSYRNGDGISHDPVTMVPVRFWPENYAKATRPIDVTAMPTPGDSGLFRFHHIELYRMALAA